MQDIFSFAFVAFSSLIVIINPVMVTSIFITLTSNARPEAKRTIIRKTTIVSFTLLLVFAMLRNATRIQKFLGPSGLNITNRLMGLVLAAIAVQFVILA